MLNNSTNDLIDLTLKKLNNDYIVFGKNRVRSTQAWVMIGLAVGVFGTLIFVANRTGQFESSLAAPPAPSNSPALLVPGNGSITSAKPSFSWTNVSRASIYRIQITVNTDISFTAPTVNSTIAATSFTPLSALSANTYRWRVRGENATGSGPWSSVYTFSVSTSADTTPPSVPTNLTASAVSSSQINLSWTASTDNVGVTGYDIYRNSVFITSVVTTSYNNIGLAASTAYTYYVKAKDAAGNISAASNSVSATTQAITISCSTVGSGNFYGCYYDNMDLTNLLVTRTDTAVNFDWGSGSPDPKIGPDTFSARWQGNFTFSAASYTFTAISDDGFRLYIDGALVLDKWIDQGPTTYTFTQNMTSGTHLVKMEYYENTGGAVAKLSWTINSNPGTGFITRNGTQLLLDGQPYRFAGVNIYNANSRDNCWYPLGYQDGKLALALSQIPGADAIRAWFYQGQAGTPTARDWKAFDQTLSVAAQYGKKVVVQLAGQGGVDCGDEWGSFRTESWYQNGYRTAPTGFVSYRSWVNEVVTRYKNDPTILAWMLVGEAEDPPVQGQACSLTAASSMKAFVDDVGSLVRAIDPNHLIALGVIGTGQCGTSGTDYSIVHASSYLDLCTTEDYSKATEAMPGDQWNGMQTRINQCNALNKPLFVQESGILLNNEAGGSETTRASYYTSKFNTQFGAGIIGELMWNYCVDHDTAYGVCDTGGYDIMPGDPTLNLLSNY